MSGISNRHAHCADALFELVIFYSLFSGLEEVVI